MTRTREQVYESFLLDEVRRECPDLKLESPDIDGDWWMLAKDHRVDRSGQKWYCGHTLSDALAALYADLKGEPAPPLPSAEEVREAEAALYSHMNRRTPLARLRSLAASDDPRDRLMARILTEADDV